MLWGHNAQNCPYQSGNSCGVVGQEMARLMSEEGPPDYAASQVMSSPCPFEQKARWQPVETWYTNQERASERRPMQGCFSGAGQNVESPPEEQQTSRWPPPKQGKRKNQKAHNRQALRAAQWDQDWEEKEKKRKRREWNVRWSKDRDAWPEEERDW